MSCAHVGLLGSLILMLGVPLMSQSPTFSTRRESVRVDVLVSADGLAVPGLGPADFEIFDSGVRQEVELASFEEVPLNVILALDMSDSLAGERLEHLKTASRAVLNALKPRDRGGLVTFSHVVAQPAALTGDLDAVRGAIDEAYGQGETALTDGIYASLLLGESSVGRSLAIVFSDGVDTASWLTADRLLDIARRSDVVVYSVSTKKTESADLLRELGSTTGGNLFEIESTKDLDMLFLRILDEFRQRYLVSYSPRGVDRAGWHRLEVRVKRRNTIVKARPGYFRER